MNVRPPFSNDLDSFGDKAGGTERTDRLDENLTREALAHWVFGDGHSVAQLNYETLEHRPDRAKLALLAAAGQLQIGNLVEAKNWIRLAQYWGVSKKLVRQILIAGAHNRLGRAAALNNQKDRALRHFESAIAIGELGTDSRLIAQAPFDEQSHQPGMPATPAVLSSAPSFPQPAAFRVKALDSLSLGDAWAGNTINTAIFRHHGILTRGKTQYTAFYVDNRTLRLVKRELATKTFTISDIHGKYNISDAHNSISLGIDQQGYLHVCYDHHATQLHYRRSSNPGDISAWTDELPMTGANEEKVTYPTFILPRSDFPLTFLYRDGGHDRGVARIKTFDVDTQSWTNHPEAILSGAEQKPWTSNAYWNHPAVGTDGSLHLSFVWRTHTLGEEQRINNINIDYACSFDNGLSWETSKHRRYKLPITQVNAETVHPVSPGSNLINQSSMALDSRNRPHIAFYADDPDGVPQYQHLWFNGKIWCHQVVSNRTQAFSLLGAGTLQVPISRPEIVIDRRDNVFILARGDHTQNRLAATFLAAPGYVYHADNIQILAEEEIGFAEPIIDRERWQQDSVLSIMQQSNEQPNHELGHESIVSPVNIVDYKFEI